MANLRGSVNSTVSFTNQPTSVASQITEMAPIPALPTIAFALGTGAGQIDLFYPKTFTVTTTDTRDLTALTDSFGNTVNFARLKFILVMNNDLTNSVVIDPTVTNGWTGAYAGPITIRPGSYFLLPVASDAVGYVTSGTSKEFTLTCTGSASVQVILAGCSI